MGENILDIILHPIRMRIILTMVGRELTARQIASAMPDVAQATLYRQLNTLAENSILQIVAERPVRGTVEKVYALDQQAANPTPENLAAMSKEDHLRYFTTFATKIIHDFSRYLDNTEKVDFIADGVSYTQAPIYLSNAELQEVSQQMNAILLPQLANKPDAKRTRRILTTIVIPSTDEPISEN